MYFPQQNWSTPRTQEPREAPQQGAGPSQMGEVWQVKASGRSHQRPTLALKVAQLVGQPWGRWFPGNSLHTAPCNCSRHV